MALNNTVWTVTQLNNYADDILKRDATLRSISIRGEISGMTLYRSSGHRYFELKDESSKISCVFFKYDAARLKFSPTDGMRVIVTGSAAVYAPQGRFQFTVKTMEADGEGELYRNYLEMKKRLESEGLFGQKRPIPFLPRCIGVVTSAEGRAWTDITAAARKRFPGMNFYLTPSLVQGAGAPESIAAGIELQNRMQRADVLIVGRGGGSYEELSCFNDEIVARALYNSRIPTVSAVGHQDDYTIADLVADVRATTPTQAGELCIPVLNELTGRLNDIRKGILRPVRDAVNSEKRHIEMLRSSAALSRPVMLIEQKRQKLEHTASELRALTANRMSSTRAKLTMLTEKLEALSPRAVVERGFAIVTDADGKPIQRAAAASPGENISIRYSDGSIGAAVTGVSLENGDGVNT